MEPRGPRGRLRTVHGCPRGEAGPGSAGLRGRPQGVGAWDSEGPLPGVSAPLWCVLCVCICSCYSEQEGAAEQSDFKGEKACANGSDGRTAHSQQRQGGRAPWKPPRAPSPCSPTPGGWVALLQRQGSPEDLSSPQAPCGCGKRILVVSRRPYLIFGLK